MSEVKTEQKRIICGHCSTGTCALLCTVENGKITKVEPDWEAPNNPGPYCMKWKYSVDYIYHKDRPMYPLKRIGKRGEGKWQRISWEQAFDEIGAKLKEIIAKYGAEAICGFIGTGRVVAGMEPMFSFFSLIGSPNAGSGQVLH